MSRWNAVVVGTTILAAVGLVNAGCSTVEKPEVAPSLRPTPAVMMFGDSLIADGEWDDLLTDERVVTYGFAGFTSGQLVPTAEDAASDKPVVVFVMAGANDLRDEVSPETTAANVGAIVDQFETTSPDTIVVVETLLPRPDAAGQVEAVNSLLRSLATERGLPLLDLRAAFDDGNGAMRPGETTDGVHLTAAGYDRWAAIITDSLSDLREGQA